MSESKSTRLPIPNGRGRRTYKVRVKDYDNVIREDSVGNITYKRVQVGSHDELIWAIDLGKALGFAARRNPKLFKSSAAE